MSGKLRFGILGCGVIGPQHALVLQDLPESAELVAVADTVPGRAEQLAARYGCAHHSSLADLLARQDIDAVCVCTPSGMHAQHAMDAIRAGKHAVIEKPVDVQLGIIDALIAAQRATDRKVAVISQHRFDRATQIVHEAAHSGKFGRLTLGTAQVSWWRAQSYYDSGEWRGTWALDGGGALMNQSVHTLDLLQWIMGEVAEVCAYSGLLAHERMEVEDTAVATLRFASGALGLLEATTAAYPGLTARLKIHGERGSAVIDNDELFYFHSATAEQEGAAYGASGGGNQAAEVLGAESSSGGPSAASDPSSLGMTHRDQIADFISAVREGGEPLVNVEEARKVVAVILAVYESARNGGRPTPV
ncbi:MAG: Gfo/Idh/MocA family oxidoreductase [Chloroflexia bacterium]|nr:Gfo/Idh/MocA family oxidoreductase [Chloroflexia bacterium]